MLPCVKNDSHQLILLSLASLKEEVDAYKEAAERLHVVYEGNES